MECIITTIIISLPHHQAQTDLEMKLEEKEEELQLLKQQAESDKEQLLRMITKRDQEHKKQLESVKMEAEQEKITMLEVCTLIYF